MTIIIKIPVGAVLENKEKTLDLLPGIRCSRCNAQPAEFFETHTLKYEAGMTRNGLIRKNFRISKRITLRLPLCANCSKSNFIEKPESCVKDQNSIGRMARGRRLGLNAGSVFAGAAFVLLMKFFSLPESIAWLQYLWMILIVMAMLLYSITYGYTELENRKFRSILRAENYDFSLRRAEVFAVKQVEDPQPDDVAVTVALKNDLWAKECAKHYKWSHDKI